MNQMTKKIIKNSLYGALGNTQIDDLYCSSCLVIINLWHTDNTLVCVKCKDGISVKDCINLDEVRKRKIDRLIK